MTNRDSNTAFHALAGFVLFVILAVTLGCSSSYTTKGNRRDATSQDGIDAKGDTEILADADHKPRNLSDGEQPYVKGEPSDADVGELPKTELELCDGSTEIRLYILAGYNKNKVQGTGNSMLILNGKCQIYLQRDFWDPIQVRTLTPAEIEELKTVLRVEQWPAIAGTYYRRDCLSYSAAWVAGHEIIVGHVACGNYFTTPAYGGEGPVPISEPAIDFLQLAENYRKEHYDEGTPVTGPVRYALFEDLMFRSPTSLFYKGAEPWPFGDPKEIAITYEDTQRNPSLYEHKYQLTDDDKQVEILRELRRQFIIGEISFSDNSYGTPVRPPPPVWAGTPILKQIPAASSGIPILQNDGTGYELFMRDTTPFEDENGRLNLPGRFNPW